MVVVTKPVFKSKIDRYGETEKFKTRLVAQRFREVEGLNCTESYSPTLTAASVRMLSVITAAQDLELRLTRILSELFFKQTWTRRSTWSFPKAIKRFRVRMGSSTRQSTDCPSGEKLENEVGRRSKMNEVQIIST